MIRRVPVSRLTPGMFVCDFGVGWMEHPFLRGQRLLSTWADVTKLQDAGIEEVAIDSALGCDVAADGVEPAVPALPVGLPMLPDPAADPLGVEMDRARRLLPTILKRITTLMDDIRARKIVDVDLAESIVEAMTGSVLRHPSALLLLLRIRDKDNYTYEHSLATCALMVGYATMLGLDQALVRQVGIGGLLHDVGKMFIPPEILNKPGALTADELAVMRTHAVLGAEVLIGTPQWGEISAIMAAHHHEQPDGGGYPNRLPSDAIGRYARMTSIVDAYDAMTSDRCYRNGAAATTVLAKMWERRDTQFDSALLQQFMRFVGIYPVGTLVRLSNEKLAIVVEQGEQNVLTPRLRVIFSIRDGTYVVPTDIDLARMLPAELPTIVGVESPARWNIVPSRFLG